MSLFLSHHVLIFFSASSTKCTASVPAVNLTSCHSSKCHILRFCCTKKCHILCLTLFSFQKLSAKYLLLLLKEDKSAFDKWKINMSTVILSLSESLYLFNCYKRNFFIFFSNKRLPFIIQKDKAFLIWFGIY